MNLKLFVVSTLLSLTGISGFYEILNNRNTIIGMILNNDNNQITIMDRNNIIYSFETDINNLSSDYIKIKYNGNLDKNILNQNAEIISYEFIPETDILSLWQDNGIFDDYYGKAYEIVQNMTLDEKIGQLLCVRFSNESEAIEAIKKYSLGGFILFEKDVSGKTKLQIKTLTSNLQSISNVPLIFAIDEEGGIVSRLNNNKNIISTPFKSPRELYLSGGFNAIWNDTIKKSEILSELGINVNLAPVVDISTNYKDYIYDRTLGENSNLTSTYAKTVIEASKLGDVTYTLKHFPGYGSNKDTHITSSVDNTSFEDLLNNNFKPFESGIDVGASLVMINHNIINSLDAKNPATLSTNVHNILRNELDFTGLILTDSLDMNSVINEDNLYVRAVLSGYDLILTTDYKSAVDDVKNGVLNGIISEELITKLAFRNISFKFYSGIIKTTWNK